MTTISVLGTTTKLLFKPYTNRLKLGEGGLVIMNFVHSIAANRGIKLIAIETVISFLAMCVLYGYNDYVDCEKDKHNPKKDSNFIALIINNKVLFIRLLTAFQIITISLSWYYLGPIIASCLAILFITNFIYSQKIKGVPIADIIIVSLWGGLYICLAGNFNLMLAVSAGLMTGIAHFFQVITDKTTDTLNEVKTTGVVLKNFELPILALLSLLLGASLYFNGAGYFVLLSAVPLVAFGLSRKVTVSWYVARVVFFILWLIILATIYGTI